MNYILWHYTVIYACSAGQSSTLHCCMAVPYLMAFQINYHVWQYDNPYSLFVWLAVSHPQGTSHMHGHMATPQTSSLSPIPLSSIGIQSTASLWFLQGGNPWPIQKVSGSFRKLQKDSESFRKFQKVSEDMPNIWPLHAQNMPKIGPQ